MVKGQAQLLGAIAKVTRAHYKKLQQAMEEKKNSYNLKYWEVFISSPSFKTVAHFLVKEETIVMF